jgi:hypothetical protein
MDKIFKFTLLKYRPSYILGEQVNIGILFIFTEDNKVFFSYPKNLARLTALYPNVDLQDTKRYLSAIQLKANKLCDKDLFIKTTADDFIEKEFFLADANSFFFSDFKVGIYETEKIEKIVTHFTHQYLAAYDPSVPARKDDDYLVRKFTEGVKATGKPPLYKKDVALSNGRVKAHFDICWQNGTTNYAKGLSFDFVKPESIQRKAVQWFGEIVQLGIGDAHFNSKRFDFWVVEPSNKQLFKPFDKALEILNSIPHNKRIITEKDINSYIEEAIETSQPIELNEI